MRSLFTAVWGILVLAVVCVGPGLSRGEWRDTFPVDKARLADTGRNSYFVLEPGYKLEYEHGRSTLTVTVLSETKVVDGVRTRVVEERETAKGALTEISRNYFAIDPASGDVYYFGEEVDNYRNGKLVGHEGSWLAGVKGARFGLFLPGKPVVGDRFYQEIAPRLAMDRVEVTGTDETVTTPAGVFQHCLSLKETTPLEPGVSHKAFAPGIGLVKDDEFVFSRKPKP